MRGIWRIALLISNRLAHLKRHFFIFILPLFQESLRVIRINQGEGLALVVKQQVIVLVHIVAYEAVSLSAVLQMMTRGSELGNRKKHH